MTSFRILLGSSLLFCSVALSQTLTLFGTVRDASTNDPLPAANIRVDGTTRGTITNADGFYRFTLPPGEYAIIFSFVGYQPNTIRVTLSADRQEEVRLTPVPIVLGEVVVTDEDPAYAIMRKVIENKGRWKEMLRSYQFDAFTRQSMKRDTIIAMISESYTTGYWQQGDTLREIVRQQRQTENIQGSQNFAAVGGIANFYDDNIRFSGFNFVGPTSRETFDYYRFKLLETRARDGIPIYTIQIIPRSRLVPLFRGTLSVAGDVYALTSVEVTPNEAYAIPFVDELDVRYAQQFDLYHEMYWMPVDIRVKALMNIGIAGFTFPRIGFDQTSVIYDYRINAEFPDTMRLRARRTKAPEAEVYDSLFWTRTEVLPLTSEERHAYITLDSTQTLQRQFEPKGPLSFLGGPVQSVIRILDVRFNRVEGFFGGIDLKRDSVISWLGVRAKLGYGFADRKTKGSLGFTLFADSGRKISVGFDLYRDIDYFYEDGLVGTFMVTASALFAKNDRRDYCYAEGWSASARVRPLRILSATLTYRAERHGVAEKRTDFSLFYRKHRYRDNPLADEGMLRTVTFKGRIGQDPIAINLIPVDHFELELETAAKGILTGSSGFTRGVVRGEIHLATFLRRNLFHPLLSARVVVGLSNGALPPQRMFSLESGGTGFGPFGVMRGMEVREFSGEQFVMISLEHNFRSIPMLALNIPYLYKRNIELVIHGAAARSWTRSERHSIYGHPTDGWYVEGGIGISRLFGLLRVDLTRRFMAPSQYVVTLSAARLM